MMVIEDGAFWKLFKSGKWTPHNWDYFSYVSTPQSTPTSYLFTHNKRPGKKTAIEHLLFKQ